MAPFFASTTRLLLFRQFYMTVPADLPDAARVDGASPMRYFLQILVPISKTNIAALFVIEFIFMWSQYLWPLIVTTTIQKTSLFSFRKILYNCELSLFLSLREAKRRGNPGAHAV